MADVQIGDTVVLDRNAPNSLIEVFGAQHLLVKDRRVLSTRVSVLVGTGVGIGTTGIAVLVAKRNSTACDTWVDSVFLNTIA